MQWLLLAAMLSGSVGPRGQRGLLEHITDAGMWGLDRIDQANLPLNRTYRYRQTGAGVSIYIIDTGIRGSHDDFGGRVSSVGDFCVVDANGDPATSNTDDVDSGRGHGTINASIAAGTRSGVAKGARVVALRAYCPDGPAGSASRRGSGDAMANAVRWITAHGRHPGVVNISFGSESNAKLQAAILDSMAAGFAYALSAACSDEGAAAIWGADVARQALVVAGVNSRDEASGRNYGPDLALFAPAVGVVGALKASDTAYGDYDQVEDNCSDSHAAPHVAGLAARYLEAHPTTSPAVLRRELISHATLGALRQVHPGAPNRLLYSGFLDSPTSILARE